MFVLPMLRYLAWPSVLFGLNTMFNVHPLRAKEGGGGWSNMAYVSFWRNGWILICFSLIDCLPLHSSRHIFQCLLSRIPPIN